jgi:hypothetical protein
VLRSALSFTLHCQQETRRRSGRAAGRPTERRRREVERSNPFGLALNPSQRTETARAPSDGDEKSRLATHSAQSSTQRSARNKLGPVQGEALGENVSECFVLRFLSLSTIGERLGDGLGEMLGERSLARTEAKYATKTPWLEYLRRSWL